MSRELLYTALTLLLSAVSAAQPGSTGRTRVVLDTDAYNEIDDQFFIAYSLFQKSFEVEGVTAAQYRIEQGSVDESYYEILRVMELMGVDPAYPVVRGADVAMPDEKTSRSSEASRLIGKLAMKPDPRPLYVLAVGALTNVASAIIDHPEIKKRIKVIWLGGFPQNGEMDEFNASNDRAAVKAVFESGVDLTVVPTETSARYLTLSYEQAEARLRHTNLLGRMLLHLLRDYGERRGKVIWDISVTAYMRQLAGGPRFFEVSSEPAPQVDLARERYVRRQGPHSITVCGKPDRDAVFRDFFQHFPEPRDRDAPYLLCALATGRADTLRLLFSELVDRASASDPKCFKGPSPVKAAASIGSSVTLTLADAVRDGVELAVACVKDPAGNPVLASRNTVPVRSVPGAVPGLRYSAYRVARGAKQIPIATGAPASSGVIETLDWPSEKIRADASGGSGALIVAAGELYLPLDHRYEFLLQASQLGRVTLGDEVLLDQSREGDQRVRRTVFRKAGLYKLRVEVYSDSGRPRLTFLWNLPFHDMSLVPDSVLLHRPR